MDKSLDRLVEADMAWQCSCCFPSQPVGGLQWARIPRGWAMTRRTDSLFPQRHWLVWGGSDMKQD